jgi:hypothetical protein
MSEKTSRSRISRAGSEGRGRGRLPAKPCVKLTVRGKSLDPAEVTLALKLKPTRAFKRGDDFKAGNRVCKRAYGAWTLTTEGAVESENITAHCEKLFEWLNPVRSALDAILSRKGLNTAVVFWWPRDDRPVGFTLHRALVDQLTRICNDLEFFLG